MVRWRRGFRDWWFLGLFGLAGATSALFTFLVGGHALRTWQAQGWVRVPARVVRADIDLRRTNSSIVFAIPVSYSYTFDNTAFTASADPIDAQVFDSEADARRALEQLRPGRVIEVRVNPDRPIQSCFTCAFDVQDGWLSLVLAGFTVSSLWVVQAIWRNRFPWKAMR